MILQVKHLPSHFKPYPFKSFKLHAINFKQAMELGANPSMADIRKLLAELTDGAIDVSLLVPIDMKYLIAMLAFQASPNQAWTLSLKCPHCGDSHTKQITAKDFPDVPGFDENDPYPLTIDDGKHVYSLGYAKAEDIEGMDLSSDPLAVIRAHILAVDGKAEGIQEALDSIEDFGIIGTMVEAIKKYFQVETYSEMECPACHKTYRVPLSAVEVTQYTPFRDSEAIGKYKVNFRL